MEFKSPKNRKNRKISFNDDPRYFLLDEESEWESLRHTVDSETAEDKTKNRFTRKLAKKTSAFDEHPKEDLRKVEVNIKLALPKINVARFKNVSKVATTPKTLVNIIKTNLPRKYAIAGGVVLILVVAGIVVGNKYVFKDESGGSQVAGTSKVNGGDVTEPTNDPKFDIVTPKGREIAKNKIIYDSKRNFTKYEDDINGTPITVSQQPLPELFKSDPASGALKVSKDFGANEEVSVEGVKMYYGQDEKGPQTLIFTKNGLLIFILTTKEVEKPSLEVYAGNLD